MLCYHATKLLRNWINGMSCQADFAGHIAANDYFQSTTSSIRAIATIAVSCIRLPLRSTLSWN